MSLDESPNLKKWQNDEGKRRNLKTQKWQTLKTKSQKLKDQSEIFEVQNSKLEEYKDETFNSLEKNEYVAIKR